MRNISILLTFILLNQILVAQHLNVVVNDTVKNRPVLVDFIDRQGLQTGEFAEWYAKEYPAYIPDVGIIGQLKTALSDIQIIVVLATWCGDSKEQVPRFLKVLDQADFEPERCTMIGVDSQKQARDLDVSVYDIERVPTFIFYRNEIEIGRIVETPLHSLESDILNICNSAK
jgi:thiol-disulfide isomerase/thioredoxin